MMTKRIIEERLMEIINKNIDDGTPFDWGRMIYIHSSFMTK